MLVYFSVLFIIMLFCYFDKSEKGIVSLTISLLLIYLMISFQSGWGGDGETYVSYFEYFHGQGMGFKELLNDERHGEPGFKFVYTIMPSFMSTQLLFAAYYCVALFILFYHFVPRKYWALYFIFMFINRPMLMGSLCAIARTGMAVSSFIIGLYFLSKRKRLWYVLILLFASLFHKSALIFLPIVLIPMRRSILNPTASVFVMVVLSLVSALVPEAWSSVVESFLSSNDNFDSYMNYIDENAAHYSLSLLIPFIILWGYYIVKYVSQPDKDKPFYLLLKVTLIPVILHLLPALGLSGRLYYYLDYIFFVGMLIILKDIKNSNERALIIISLLFVYGRWFLEFWSTPYFHEKWMVYHPFWQ